MNRAADYVLNAPGALSDRAVTFLRNYSHRVNFDRGNTGNELRRQIVEVYGEPNDEIVELLDWLQSRYGGLAYQSGYFEADVTFSPVCEPEDPEEELEVLYAVQTGSSVGASVKSDGSIEIGFDQAGISDFASLDTLIECDSMFRKASLMSANSKRFLEGASIETIADRLKSDRSFGLTFVPEASGRHSIWFEGASMSLFISDVWDSMGLLMPPFMFAAAESERDIARMVTAIKSSSRE
jgi:hypothetical protein